MILIDQTLPTTRAQHSISITAGVSDEARFIDMSAEESIHRLKQAYSLDDGRMHVLMMLDGVATQCSAPGWDGYDAEPVKRATVEVARRFISALPTGFPMPTVGAEPDGHITLEWYRNPNCVVSVSISPEHDLHYAALFSNSARQNGTETFFGSVPDNLLSVINRVLSV